MSKTTQRKRAAAEKGAADGFKGRPKSWPSRVFKADYDNAYMYGAADRQAMLRKAREAKGLV